MVLIEQQIYNKFEITICQIFINQLKTIIMKKKLIIPFLTLTLLLSIGTKDIGGEGTVNNTSKGGGSSGIINVDNILVKN